MAMDEERIRNQGERGGRNFFGMIGHVKSVHG